MIRSFPENVTCLFGPVPYEMTVLSIVTSTDFDRSIAIKLHIASLGATKLCQVGLLFPI